MLSVSRPGEGWNQKDAQLRVLRDHRRWCTGKGDTKRNMTSGAKHHNKVKRHFRAPLVTAPNATCQSCWVHHKIISTKVDQENALRKRTAAQQEQPSSLKSSGERTWPWAMPESADRWEPERTWDCVPREKWHRIFHMRPWTLASNRRANVPLTHEVSNAFWM